MKKFKKTIITSLMLYGFLLAKGQTNLTDRLEFKYIYTQDTLDTTLFHIEAKIINKTNSPIYFLSESCNSLDYYLSSSEFDVYILLYCNATFPVKNVIYSKSEYLFKTTLKMRKEKKKINLELNLVELDSSSKIEGKSVDQVRKDCIRSSSIMGVCATSPKDMR